MRRIQAGLRVAAWALVALPALGAIESQTEFLSYDDARAVIEAMRDRLPEGLRGLDERAIEQAWPGWAKRKDVEIRARLEAGDEDTVTNLLLFGTSFTSEPRITQGMLAAGRQDLAAALADPESPLAKAVRKRAADLVTALAAPGENERLQFARRVLERKGIALEEKDERTRANASGLSAADYLLQHFVTLMEEYERYQKLLEAAARQGDRSAEMATRSTLFQGRGISLDTSWQPNFAIERALAAIEAKGLLAAGSVRRAAVIGPGLDFTDKDEGYDFYPPQTVQPFALVDSLVKLGLAKAHLLEVTSLDISARVNDHLAQARERAGRGKGYTIELTLDPAIPWKPEAVEYWKTLGGRIGKPTAGIAPPAAVGRVDVRAVEVRPTVVLRVKPRDLDVVLERIKFARDDERFDLVIATNVLVYYDLFEQGLALENIAAMIRPGGFLLTNDALLQVSTSGLHIVGNTATVYSDRKEDADYVVWYQDRKDGGGN